MKKKFFTILFFLSLLFLTACQKNSNQVTSFSSQALTSIKGKAKIYSEKELQSGKVPLNDFIKIEGEIIKADRGSKIKKGDRFILHSEGSDYQIFNEQEKKFSIGDEVIVYGEYYGFIKGIVLEDKK